MKTQYKPVKCKRCGYKWTPTVKHPKACTRCKRYDWDKDGVKTRVKK